MCPLKGHFPFRYKGPFYDFPFVKYLLRRMAYELLQHGFSTRCAVCPPTGRIAIYYSGTDAVTALGFRCFDAIMDFLKVNSEFRNYRTLRKQVLLGEKSKSFRPVTIWRILHK